MLGAAAAGEGNVQAVASRLTLAPIAMYEPAPERHRAYNRLFAEYRRLHDLFAGEGRGIMHALKTIQRESWMRR